MAVRGVDHIELVVRDVDQFVDLFQALGFRLLRRTSHHNGSAELQLPGPNQPIFEIHTIGGEENPGLNHICFLVDDLDQDYDALVVNGVPLEGGVHLVRASGRRLANFRDPDGFRMQLTDPKRIEPEHE